MKEFFKKHWKLISIISAAVVAAVVTVVLCVCLIPAKKKKPLGTPQIELNQTLITWDIVDNADNGYTVKINGDESTVVTVTQFDLKDAKAGLIVEGDNTVSVKANATDGYLAGAYSNEVIYIYTPSASGKQQFAAPEIELDGDVLSWNAVDGADNGYTVKIGSHTFTVNATTLDLTADEVTAVLVRGSNVISVKVNATEEKDESVYSQTVTYEYVISASEEADAFKAAVNAIGTVTASSEEKIITAKEKYAVLSDEAKAADGVDEAIEALIAKDGQYFGLLVSQVAEVGESSSKSEIDATETAYAAAVGYYAELIDNSQSSVVGAKAALDANGEKLNTLKTTIANQIAAYVAAVGEAEEACDETEAAAIANLTAAVAKVEAVTVCVAAKDYDDYKTAASTFATLETTLDQWTEAKEQADTSLAYRFAETDGDDEAAEENYAKAVELLAVYDGLPVYVQGALTQRYEAINLAKAAAATQIEATVDGIMEAVETALENTAPNEANYTALEVQKTTIENINGAYAAEYLSQLKTGGVGLLAAVESAMDTMLATVVNSEDGEAYSLTGTTLKITLFRTFYNFRNDKIATADGANAPKLTVDGNTVTVEQNFVKNDLNEYVAIINIENLGAMGDDATYTVTVGSEEKQSPLKFGETLADNPYFTDTPEMVDGKATGFKQAISDGSFIMNFQAGCTAENYYLEVYNASAITKYGEFVRFTEMPLGRIDVTGMESMETEEFNRLIANTMSDLFVGKEMTVRFMIYGETVTDGVPSFTAMNASVISEAITFNLVEEDKYYTLPVANINNSIGTNNEGTLYLVVAERKGEIINFVNSSLEAAGVGVTLDENNYKDYLQMKIEVYDTNDGNQTVLYTKYTEIEFMGANLENIINEWQREYFTEHGDVEEPEYKIGLRISYWAKPDTEISKYFPRANYADAGITYEGTDYQVDFEKELTLSKQLLTLPDTGLRVNGGGNAFEFLRDSVGSGKILTDGDALYLEIKFYLADGDEETNVNYAYLFNVDGTAVIYKNLEDAGVDGVTARQEVAAVGDSYVFFDGIKAFFNSNYTANGFPMRWDDGWTFTARYVLNPESENYLFEGGWSTPVAIEAAPATKMPDHVQIGNDGNGNIIFIRKPDGSQDGTVFTEGGAERIEYYFYAVDGEKAYDYCIFMKYSIEDKTAALYYNDGTQDVYLTGCGAANDSWCTSGDLVNAMNAYLTAMHAEDNVEPVTTDTLNEWSFVSVIVAREGNKIYIEEQKESDGSWTYSYTAA